MTSRSASAAAVGTMESAVLGGFMTVVSTAKVVGNIGGLYLFSGFERGRCFFYMLFYKAHSSFFTESATLPISRWHESTEVRVGGRAVNYTAL